MSTDETPSQQVLWSPDELPDDVAKGLQDKEEARAKRGAKKAAEALAAKSEEGGAESTPAKKRRGRTSARTGAKTKAAAEASVENVPKKEPTAGTGGDAPAAVAPSAPVPPPVAETPAVVAQTPPPAPVSQSAPTAGIPEQQRTERPLPPEGPQQPLSKRQQRRQQWLANRAARQGKPWPNNGGNGNGGNGQYPQGNRRPQDQQRHQQQRYEAPPPSVPRNPDLPEYRLQDIHTWDNAQIVDRMMPDANAEDLGAMKRHEIIFAAIRNYLARGGAVTATDRKSVV